MFSHPVFTDMFHQVAEVGQQFVTLFLGAWIIRAEITGNPHEILQIHQHVFAAARVIVGNRAQDSIE
jgi:hypothetical protein